MDIEFAGDVVEWQTLLSGMQIATLEGASADGSWTLSGSCSWNVRSGPDASEGDLTLSRNDGAELFATLAGGTVSELPSDAADAAGYDLRLDFAIDGGTGDFDAATGAIRAECRLSREGFSLRLQLSVSEA
ncbi:MAG: hypothetical protein EPO22_03760 [Dehalococcoidia bacterium]|nr:MAG: hypothetical protein EPO22_03760 [Dehalococcoidia bacterium]